MATEIRIALLVVATLAAVLLLLLLYLVIRKLIGNRSDRLLEAQLELVRPALFAYLIHGKSTRKLEPDGKRIRLQAMESLLDGCVDVMSGDDTEERIAAYADKTFAGPYRARLRSRSWGKRMNTLYRVERFRMISLEPELAAMLEDRRQRPTDAEVAQICKTLAAWGSDSLLVRLKSSPPSVSEFQRRLILSRMSDELFARYIAELEAYPREWRLPAVDIIGIKRKLPHASTLVELLGHEDSEYRIRALKALCELPVSVLPGQLLRHAEAAEWQERTMAARLFGRIRQPQLLPRLQSLLSDGSWYVRSQAAQSILAYSEGRDVLERIAAHGNDRYARDMAAEWSERRLEDA